MIKKILIANRGEIAIRIMRSCKEMNILSVAVFSDADRNSMHVRYANEAINIGHASAKESYLNVEKIIDAAKTMNADAIHPGYGFLSENAEFADRCTKESIIFIGPSAYSIATMGNKITARQTMIKAGIPVVPGTTGKINTESEVLDFIEKVGLPVIIKASAGGGGKGMRLVHKKEEISEFFHTAQSEALAAFGDDSVYVEKYIESPHHIEFQILADKSGNTIHLFERECSIQRRHQKVIEETPSPHIIPRIRKEMGECAITAAKAVNYESAGTIEFIVDKNYNYYFLEMNTRLQVEHPITECVVGIDIVKEQINIANGLSLSIKQKDLRQNGHAIQCRIYAEDADNNFMPSPGVIKHLTEPSGFGVRCDGYVYDGYEIPIHYDPIISKLIVWGQTRTEAIARMKRALYEYKITGVNTSIKFLERIMDTPDFISGKYNTHFIEKNTNTIFTSDIRNKKYEDIAIISAFIDYSTNLGKMQYSKTEKDHSSEWKSFGRKRNVIRL